MGRRSFSRPGALRFTAAPCSRLAKRRAVQQGGRPAIHSSAAPPHGHAAASGAAPPHNNPRRPAAQPPLHGHPATGHEMAGKPARQPPAGPPSPAPSCINPPGHRPSAPSRITPRNRRPSAPSCITPRNRRPPPSSRITPRGPRDRAPSPSGKREPRPRLAPLRMHDRYIRSVVGPPARAALSPLGNANHAPGARRCACPTATSVLWRVHPARAASPREEGVRGAENILFLIPEYPLTTA